MNLSIDTLAIRQDAHGRFNLNDLYRASGGGPKNRPSYWLSNKQTVALVQELEREAADRSRNSGFASAELEAGIPASNFSPVNTIQGGDAKVQGSYVVEELVYAYAMWISPAFHIKVIRTFRAAMTDGFVKSSIQAENFWFALRPHWRQIRDMAASGMRYTEIALAVGRSADSVGRCVRRMIEVGLINPTALFLARFKPITAKRIVSQSQLCLSWGATA